MKHTLTLLIALLNRGASTSNFVSVIMRDRIPYIVLLLVTISATCIAQSPSEPKPTVNNPFPWQKPVKRDPAEIERIVGPVGKREPSRDLNIVWVWCADDNFHLEGTHRYAKVMELYVNGLLPRVPRVTAVSARNFPTKEQWEKADLVVCYSWPSRNGKWDFKLIDEFQKRGGGLMFIHQALARDIGSELSQRIGLEQGGSWAWGVLPTPVTLTDAARKSPIFQGFPEKFDLSDEFYWNLRGDPAGVTPLVTAPAGPAIASKPLSGPPRIEDLDGKEWPVMWTKEVGRSRVFVTAAGHNYFTFEDPYFRIILLRAMAWTMNESFDPFKPLVTLQVER